MSITTEEKHDEMPFERDVSLQNGALPDNKSIDDDSDSPPLERPTSLSVGSKYDRISVDESLESERYLCISNQSRGLFIDHPESISFVCVFKALLDVCFNLKNVVSCVFYISIWAVKGFLAAVSAN